MILVYVYCLSFLGLAARPSVALVRQVATTHGHGGAARPNWNEPITMKLICLPYPTLKQLSTKSHIDIRFSTASLRFFGSSGEFVPGKNQCA